MSMPLLARNSRCDAIRFSSVRSIRIQVARGGTSTPSSVSVAMENTSSLKNGEA